MALATILSRSQHAMSSPPVRVEVHVGSGLPAFSIVGLPEAVVKESRDRVRSAIQNCRLDFPSGHITVNLAPADLPKEGGRFDLPIAIGILVASAQLPDHRLADTELYGELSLSGELQGIRGALPTTLHATRAGRMLVLPECNLAEASVVRGARVLPARHLLDVCRHARGLVPLPLAVPAPFADEPACGPELGDVRGQMRARRALEIAAAGEHSLLLVGPPGSGKSMLAQRLPGLLPPMSEEEALEAASIASLSGRPFAPSQWRRRPFRSPHHSASAIALVGGGGRPRPGEISLAHNGVLFLDELPEFDRRVLEVLREPLESGVVSLSRAARQADFPARFQLVAAMNPCPCGHLGDPRADCRCPPDRIARYRGRVSGPLLDRIDLHVEMPRIPAEELATARAAESTAEVAERVAAARRRQLDRQRKANARLDGAELAGHCPLQPQAAMLLEEATRRLALSARAHHRVLRVARTIADLAGAQEIGRAQVAEAVSLRQPDRGAGGGPASTAAISRGSRE